MKKIKLLGLAFIAMCFTFCNSENYLDDSQTETNSPKTYEISLNLGGEYVEISEMPLTRTNGPKKYYAINIYCMKTDNTESDYSSYAYGVFDNKEDMKITLLSGYKYKFECTSVTDGKDTVTNSSMYLYWPGDDSYWRKEINKFSISTYKVLLPVKEGRLLVWEDSFDRYLKHFPDMDRYYGELEDYVPTNEGIATIPMKRTVFGMKMIINGVPDGELSWSVKGMSDLSSSHTGNHIKELSIVRVFNDIYSCWKEEDYTYEFTVSFAWRRLNGYFQEFEKEITVKRNVMTIINVALTGGSSEIGIGIQEEDAEMVDEHVEVNYNGGDLKDTEINPEENE